MAFDVVVVVTALKLFAFTDALLVMLYDETLASAAIFLTCFTVAVGIVIAVGFVSLFDVELALDWLAFICSNIFSRLADKLTVEPTALAALLAAVNAAF